jgi:hypothetical protein
MAEGRSARAWHRSGRVLTDHRKDSGGRGRTPSAMSVSTEVRRTLVKSPPELWSELSDPSSLAKHLGELGEIRIVRTDPEKVVDWEATAADGAQASGTVQIEPSGWGTKVTLSASLTVAAPVASEPEPGGEVTVEPAPEPEPEMTVEPEPEQQPAIKHDPKPKSVAELEPVPPGETKLAATAETISEPEPAPEPESEPALEPKPEPERHPGFFAHQGFFARLFRRRRQQPPELDLPLDPEPTEAIAEATVDEPAIEEPAAVAERPAGEPPEIESPAPVPAEPTPEQLAAAEPTAEQLAAAEPTAEQLAAAEPTAEQPPSEEPAAEPDIAGELAIFEEQTTAVLTGVLDRLGAAHHRPFSRA